MSKPLTPKESPSLKLFECLNCESRSQVSGKKKSNSLSLCLYLLFYMSLYIKYHGKEVHDEKIV